MVACILVDSFTDVIARVGDVLCILTCQGLAIVRNKEAVHTFLNPRPSLLEVSAIMELGVRLRPTVALCFGEGRGAVLDFCGWTRSSSDLARPSPACLTESF